METNNKNNSQNVAEDVTGGEYGTNENISREEQLAKLKKQRRRQLVASTLGLAILAWGVFEVVNIFLDYSSTETSNDAQVEQYLSPVNMRAAG